MSWADHLKNQQVSGAPKQTYHHQPGCVKGGLISEVFSLWVQSSKIEETNHFGKSGLKPTNFHSRLTSVFLIKLTSTPCSKTPCSDFPNFC